MIVVTTPTGQIGRHVVRHLLDAGEAFRVVVRDPARLPAEVRDTAEVVAGSHGDAAVIDHALDGAEALFWVAPPTPQPNVDDVYVNFTRPAAAAIARHGVARVVVVTALGRGTRWADRAGLVTASLRMDDLLRETGAAVRELAMPGFMDNLLQQAGAIRGGQMFGPLDADRAVPYTATRDMGAAAARLLRDRTWTGADDVPLLGPEDLTGNDLARIVGEVVGREVRYVQVPFDAFEAQLRDGGMPPGFAAAFVEMMRAKNEGMDNVAQRTPATTAPTTFRAWAEAELKPAVAAA